MQRKKKKISAVLLVTFLLTMVFSGGAWAASFPDIASDHWALQNLERMSARGVIGGYEDGTARPDIPVTQFEAVIMAARMMGISKQTADVAKGVYLPFSYPEWSGAYEIAAVAYENGLIDASDFQHDGAASREWVAKLLVKAMKQENSINMASSENLTFTDTYNVGVNYLNYVKRANQLGLIGGYPDGTFLPKKTVSRAEMVTFLVRAENQLQVKADNLIIGTVEKVNGVNIVLMDNDGISHNLYATTNSKMYNASGQSISVSGITAGSQVYAVTKNALLNYLELSDGSMGQLKAANIMGSITAIVSDKKTLIITDKEDKLNTVLVDKDTVIKTDDGTDLAFEELAINDAVEISADADQIANKIVVVVADSDQSSGVIYNVDEYNRLIIIEEKTGLRTYKMANNMSVSISGMLSATVSSLKEGDEANYTVVDGVMTAIAVSGNTNSYGGNGIFKSLDTDNRIINYTDSNGSLKADYYNTSTIITFADGETGSVTDLQSGDSLQITVKGGVISEIKVQNRKASDGLKGKVYAIDRTNNVLTLEDAAGTKTAYDIADTVKVTVYGELATLTSVIKDMKVEVTLVNNKITKINASDRIEGVVTAVNTNNSTITVKTEEATTTYDVADSSLTVYEYSSINYRLSAVSVGDTVSMKVVNDEVNQIYVVSKQDMTVVSVYSNYLRATDSNGNSQTLYTSAVDIIVDGVSGQDITQISAGDTIMATYMGDKLTEIECTRELMGQITSVNSTTKTITVKTYGSKTYTVSFGDNCYVVKNGSNSSSITTMVPGDRVIIGVGSSNGREFQVMSVRTDNLQYATTGILKFLSDNIYYKPPVSCYAHYANSTTQIPLTSLGRNDKVTIYYTPDLTVYEVEKH